MSSATITTTVESPIGPLLLAAEDGRVTRLTMEEHRHAPPASPQWRRDDAWFAPLRRQLDAYFAGELTDFDFPLELRGSPFQQRVWEALRGIPYGSTVSYGTLAERLGNPKACRAVGLANGRNPVSIVVPCHRVVGADGTLTGYGGGLDRKRWLLAHEASVTRR